MGRLWVKIERNEDGTYSLHSGSQAKIRGRLGDLLKAGVTTEKELSDLIEKMLTHKEISSRFLIVRNGRGEL